MLDAIKNNTVVKRVSIYENSEIGRQLKLSQALVKLSEIMKCNKSVESLAIFLRSSGPGVAQRDQRLLWGLWDHRRDEQGQWLPSASQGHDARTNSSPSRPPRIEASRKTDLGPLLVWDFPTILVSLRRSPGIEWQIEIVSERSSVFRSHRQILEEFRFLLEILVVKKRSPIWARPFSRTAPRMHRQWHCLYPLGLWDGLGNIPKTDLEDSAGPSAGCLRRGSSPQGEMLAFYHLAWNWCSSSTPLNCGTAVSCCLYSFPSVPSRDN